MTTHRRYRTVILACLWSSLALSCQSARANTKIEAPRRGAKSTEAAPRNTPRGNTAIKPDATPSNGGAQPDNPNSAADTWRHSPTGPTQTWLSIGRVDPNGRWLYFCQANDKFDDAASAQRTRGSRSSFIDDTFTPYFSSTSTAMSAVDALLTSSPFGRYVVLARHGQAELLDVTTGKSIDLSARGFDIRGDVLPGDWRSIAFSPQEDKVAFLVNEQHPRVIVRNLETAVEVQLTPVGEMVWRIGFDASGKYVVLDEVLEDSNQNGKLTWPFGEYKLRDTHCKSNVPAFAAYTPTGDTPQTSIAPVTGGKARLVPGFIAGLGRSVIVKSPRGELSAVDGSQVRPFGSRNCDAQVVAIAPERDRLLVGCQNASGRSELEVDTLSNSHKLDLDVPYSKVDWLTPDNAKYAVVYPGARAVLVDWARDRVVPLADRDQVLAQGPSGVLVRRGSSLLMFDPPTSHTQPLMDGVSDTARIIMGNGVAAVGNVIVSAAQGRVLGTLKWPILAIDSAGCGLVSLSESSHTQPLTRGPLSWACPGE